MKHFSRVVFAVFLLLVVPGFSESLNRPLSLKTPRMNGADVKELQTMLLSLGFTIGAADGFFGPLTSDAVQRLQYFLGFDQNGVVDQPLWTALGARKGNTLLSLYWDALPEVVRFSTKNWLKEEADLNDFSTEGGHVTVYRDQRAIRSIAATFYGESFQNETEYKFLKNYFTVVERTTQRYLQPLDPHGAEETSEVYFYHPSFGANLVSKGMMVPSTEDLNAILNMVNGLQVNATPPSSRENN